MTILQQQQQHRQRKAQTQRLANGSKRKKDGNENRLTDPTELICFMSGLSLFLTVNED